MELQEFIEALQKLQKESGDKYTTVYVSTGAKYCTAKYAIDDIEIMDGVLGKTCEDANGTQDYSPVVIIKLDGDYDMTRESDRFVDEEDLESMFE